MSDKLDLCFKEKIKYQEDKIERLRKEIVNKQKEIIYALKEIAKLKGEKVFVSASNYNVDYTDYYIAKNKNDIEHADCELSIDNNYNNGEFYDEVTRELQQNEDIVELEY